MIVWLASYPRSGNTLLRTILFQCFGLESYSDHIAPDVRSRVALTERSLETFGHRDFAESWGNFCENASASTDIKLVKTHDMPLDTQKFIYIIRDGRAAVESYFAYHEAFKPDSSFCPSLMDLIMGNDYYGNWSSHYNAWMSRDDCSCLLVSYEQLVTADLLLLEQIASFIGYQGDIKPFINPLASVQSENPDFFRQGQTIWHKPDHWSGEIESLFLALHGELMLKLNYINQAEFDKALQCVSPLALRLGLSGKRAYEERNIWHKEALAKENVIRDLLAAQDLPKENQIKPNMSILRKLTSWVQ